MRPIWFAVLPAAVPLEYAHPWAEDGHSIVAEIAQRRLSDAARPAVDQVLKHGSLASVSSWADDIKFTERPDTKPWHFVDIPVAESTYDPATQCVDDACVIAALANLRPALQCGKDDKAKLDALRFVVHFVGDIHQPLHTVKDATGGNTIPVKVAVCGLIRPGCTPQPESVNFHEAWDETLIKRTIFDWGAYVDRLESGWLQTPAAQAVATDGTGPEQWARQTHVAAQFVWNRKPANDVLDESYYNDVLPTIDRQLGTAGLRLARFLNEAYSPATCPAK
jgi:hypothetical protein